MNNAGISHIGLLQDMTPADWERMLRTNLTSAFQLLQAGGPLYDFVEAGKNCQYIFCMGRCGRLLRDSLLMNTKGGINALDKGPGKGAGPQQYPGQCKLPAEPIADTEMNQWMDEDEPYCPGGTRFSPGALAALRRYWIGLPSGL